MHKLSEQGIMRVDKDAAEDVVDEEHKYSTI